MKTKQIALLAFTAILTNPSKEDHKEKVKETLPTFYQKTLKETQFDSENSFAALGSLIGESIVNTFIENAITRDNYVLFSLNKISYRGEEKSIGFGLFGNVFLSDRVEEAFNKNRN